MEADPELVAAVNRNAASFDQWIRAYFTPDEVDDQRPVAGEGEGNPDGVEGEPVERSPEDGSRPDGGAESAQAQFRAKIFAAFENSEGRVYSSFYCQRVVGAAALTLRARPRLIGSVREEPILHAVYNVAESQNNPQELEQLQALLYDAHALSVQVNELLKGEQRRILLEDLYGLTTDLLDLLDTGETTGETRSFDAQRSDLERMKKKLGKSGTAQGQVVYLIGMLEGAGLLGILAALCGWLLRLAGVSGFTVALLMGAFLSGGIGAIISVLSRMTGGSLNVQFEMGRKWLAVVGALRPFVGGVFGLVLFGLIEGKFLPISVTGDELAQFSILAVLAFAAGFNERWAQDVLLQTTGGSTQKTNSRPPESPDT